MTQPVPDISSLTLEEKIGQMLCLGWGGADSLLTVNAQARECVLELKAGAMVVMGRNVQQAGQPLPPIDAGGVRALLEELQSLATVPLLLSTDQEGGRVARFGTEPFTRMPSAKVIGDQGDTVLAREAARVTAVELAAVGVNWDFAPVADVNSNPANPVIGDRSFGDRPDTVIAMTTAQITGYTEGGVLACAKHFPGHGDTSVDSHFALPTLPHDLATMDTRELEPFLAAITAGVPSIMTAHILFPAVDSSGLPATMSPAILTGLLRERLRFTGLIVTDCLEMNAVADQWGTPRAAVLAVIAGADMLLVCHTLERQRATRDALLAAVQDREIALERVDEAVSRILAAKRQVVKMPQPGLAVIGSPAHRAVREALTGSGTVAERSFTTLGAEAPR